MFKHSLDKLIKNQLSLKNFTMTIFNLKRGGKKNLTVFCFLLAILASCGCPQCYYPSATPPPLPSCPVIQQPVRIALVLGGGGAKGLAHVGVIEELELANIPIDLIIGCSAGSIVGSLYCDDPSANELKNTLLKMITSVLIDFDLKI